MEVVSYPTLTDAWIEIGQALISSGGFLNSRDGGCLEAIGVAFQVDPLQCFVYNPVRKASATYGAAEFLWYMLGTDSIEMIQAYAPQYERFGNDGKAHGAYGHRWSNDPVFRETGTEMLGKVHPGAMGTQIQAVCSLLRDKPDTRQAVVTMWNAGDLLWAIEGSRKDIPCTLSIQFHLRNNELHMVVTMRSQDLWLGLPYDAFCFAMLQQMMATELGAEMGTYTHCVGSLHLYERNQRKMDEAIRAHDPRVPGVGCRYTGAYESLGECIGGALRMEQEMRTGQFERRTMRSIAYEAHEVCGRGTMATDLLMAVAMKWRPDLSEPLAEVMTEGSLLREAVR